ncbi:hypothetical protein [Parvibaculum sp.]|uniref:hypothetical protein n=1 Tax=Parvibaculum sp. TaxID=2024848 RepID=UPI002737198D|nr:hypothetical protein [Parvibaculum sp.]MDP3329392.1 hypothetical protein [Parvibaculum sp.]
MTIASEIRNATGAMASRIRAGTMSEKYLEAWGEVMSALADQVAQLEGMQVPPSARVNHGDLPPGIVSLLNERKRA